MSCLLRLTCYKIIVLIFPLKFFPPVELKTWKLPITAFILLEIS